MLEMGWEGLLTIIIKLNVLNYDTQFFMFDEYLEILISSILNFSWLHNKKPLFFKNINFNWQEESYWKSKLMTFDLVLGCNFEMVKFILQDLELNAVPKCIMLYTAKVSIIFLTFIYLQHENMDFIIVVHCFHLIHEYFIPMCG
jgi:hypothetical protein